jgi:hypothetical protein
MTKEVMTKWRASELGEGRMRQVEIITIEEVGGKQWRSVFQCPQTTEG